MVFDRKEDMKLGILNSELGIVAIDTLDDLGYIHTQEMKKCLPKGNALEDLAFFYLTSRDLIVINKSHENHKIYLEIIQEYLQLSSENRKAVREEAPNDKIKKALHILENIINRRIFIYGSEHAKRLFEINFTSATLGEKRR